MHPSDPAKGRKPAFPDDAGMRDIIGLAISHFAVSASYTIATPELSARRPQNTTAVNITQKRGSRKTTAATRACALWSISPLRTEG